MNESIVQCREDAVRRRMQGDEHDASDSQKDGDDATNGVWQYDSNEIFGKNENEKKDDISKACTWSVTIYDGPGR